MLTGGRAFGKRSAPCAREVVAIWSCLHEDLPFRDNAKPDWGLICGFPGTKLQPGYREAAVALILRTLVYATLFIGFLLVYLPARVLAGTGIHRPVSFGAAQMAGAVVCAVGAALALWCVAAFVRIGKGTPAPFDAPRRLVIRGPYQFVRNPMYLGAGLALAGAALFYRSGWLLGYAMAFLLAFHLFVVFYEEPALGRKFGADYEEYKRQVHRWRPGRAATRERHPVA